MVDVLKWDTVVISIFKCFINVPNDVQVIRK